MKKKPNLLFIGIDSLRRDRMSLYGYPRLTTPHMDSYLKAGAVWNSCFSASIPTTSGYANMLSGHDVFGTDNVALRHQGTYAPGVVTLPEILKENGYATSCVGFSGNPASRGFDKYTDYSGWGSWEEGRSHKAENLNAVALPELKRLAGQDKPFLLFLRHMDPHSPYLPPEPYERIFYPGDEFDKKNKSLEKTYAFKPFRDYFYSWFPPGCTDAEYVKAQYDGEVAYMDACIAVILEELTGLGLADETLVVITSDHGETLDEHECWFDHHGLYECTLNVPLAFRMPGKVPQGARFDDIVTLKDVLPTVLDIMGINRRGIPMEGRSLLARMSGGELKQEPEFYITECTWERKHGWRTPQYKLIRALEPDFHYREPVELYDLIKDPGENNNIAKKESAIVKTLSDRMDQWIQKREKETGRTAPIVTNLHWHGIGDREAFTSSDEAYNTMHIGDTAAAQKLQAALKKGKK
jgi:arylsulfatase A-like enzyme